MTTGDTGMKVLKDVLTLVQENLPELYAEKIRGKWAILIAEAEAELLKDEQGLPNIAKGETISKLSLPLKFLFALVRMFEGLAKESIEKHRGVELSSDPMVFCDVAHAHVFVGISISCVQAFWDAAFDYLLIETRKKNHGIRVAHDWKFVACFPGDIPPTSPRLKNIFSSLKVQLFTAYALGVIGEMLSQEQDDRTEHF